MAADVATNIEDWSITESGNLPAGTTAISTNLDDNLRMIQAAVRALFSRDTIASAATCDIGAKNVRSLDVTGTTTITSLGATSVGIKRLLTFAGVLTLTHSASLACLTAANITTEAGDMCELESVAAGWQMLWYSRKSGASLAIGGLVINGSAAAPALAFLNSPTTGIYRQAADSIGLSTAGTLRVTLNATNLISTLPVLLPNGSSGAPSIGRAAGGSAGLYFAGANDVTLKNNGNTCAVTVGTGSTGEVAASSSTGQTVVGISSSYSGAVPDPMLTISTARVANSTGNMLTMTADSLGTPNLIWRVRQDGATFADGAYSGSGADYAEAFLVDGDQPQPGDPVVLSGSRVRIATGSDSDGSIIGVVSEQACAIGDAKLIDIGGVPVGLIGKLRVNAGRPVRSSWRPLGDGRYLVGVA